MGVEIHRAQSPCLQPTAEQPQDVQWLPADSRHTSVAGNGRRPSSPTDTWALLSAYGLDHCGLGGFVIRKKVTGTTTSVSCLQTKVGTSLCDKAEVNFLSSWQSVKHPVVCV